jgi:hypothetical protein
MLEVLADYLLYGKIKVKRTPKLRRPSAIGITPEQQQGMTPREVEPVEKKRHGEQRSISSPPALNLSSTPETTNIAIIGDLSSASSYVNSVSKFKNISVEEVQGFYSKMDKLGIDYRKLIEMPFESME